MALPNTAFGTENVPVRQNSRPAKSAEGRAKIAAANTTTGQHTRAMIARRKKDAKIAKGLRDRLRVIEENLRRHGVVD